MKISTTNVANLNPKINKSLLNNGKEEERGLGVRKKTDFDRKNGRTHRVNKESFFSQKKQSKIYH